MHKFLLIPAFALLPLLAAAQGAVYDHASVELNKELNAWMQSENAAGLAFAPLKPFSTVDLSYSIDSGDYRLRQTGKHEDDIKFGTEGATSLGKMKLWGHFSYDYITSKGSTYNTVLYDPLDERLMYTVADTTASTWKRQSYFMEFKAALPIVGDKLFGGLHLQYNDKVAAKQQDPRSESYNCTVKLYPSVVYKFGRHSAGLTLHYAYLFERSVPTNSNSQKDQLVYLLKGLGNYTTDYVGSSSLGTMYFRCNTYGGSLQYALDGPLSLLAEAGYKNHETKVTESATQPDHHGKTVMDELFAGVQAQWGREWRSSAELSLSGNFVTGTEYTTIFDSSTGEYEIRSAIEQVKLKTYEAVLSYDAYKLQGLSSFIWHLALEAGFKMKDDSYALPSSTLDYSNAWLKLSGSRRIPFRSSSLLLSARVKGQMNLSGDYVYGGELGDSVIVQDMYFSNHTYLVSDFVVMGLSADYALSLKSSQSLGFSLSGDYCRAESSRSRFSISAGVSLLF